ncbi:integrin alpha-9 isoform X2 [Nematostella vectensis]|uniref:integrin alpha-9 isoform X2 n=1 Tax=Nematostella vectensis TaxID=45351 RepID=UPI0020771E61|nr:integrin alpha-9 isoform X2 [Nematostella vectensis]
MVCAPRYSHKQDARHEKKLFNGPKLNNFPSGRCFLLHSNLSGVEDILQPCKRQSNNPYNGYCQLGLSAASIDNSSSVVMGVVGLGNDTARLVYTGGVERYSPESRAFAVSLFDQRLKRDDYMGYGVAVLRFENTTGIAGGAPRGDNLEGKVFIYEDRKDGIVFQSTLERPKDSQVGSYFGSSVCAVDLNNDGLTDLLVGAPLFTMTMDEGRVYVYISNKDGVLSWAKSMTLTGDSVPGARFGFALADAGDLNRDGFHDVVVGAPYEGPNSEGAVYVYHGNKQGIQNRYQQKIFASSLSSSLRGFGCSVSGAVDVDYNGYPDLVVGAYKSDHAVLLRTSRIIHLEASIALSRSKIVLENSDHLCVLEDGTRHKCLNATFCFKFSDREPSNRKDLRISYRIELDKDKIAEDLRRIFFLTSAPVTTLQGETTIPQGQELHCLPVYPVYIREKFEILDLLTPMTFDVTFDLVNRSCEMDGNVPCPVLDGYRPTSLRNTELNFQKQCRGVICEPDMTLRGTTRISGENRVLHIGSSDIVKVDLDLVNIAQDASYLTKLVLELPLELSYIGPTSTEFIQCTASYGNVTATVTCDVGNPFKGKSKKKINIAFEASRITHSFIISAFVTSANIDVDLSNNRLSLPVRAAYVADVAISGVSQPSEVIYHVKPSGDDVEFQTDIGPVIVQTLMVVNHGPSSVEQVGVSVDTPQLLPGKLKDDYLLYLLKVELTSGAGRCNAISNPLRIPSRNHTQWNEHPEINGRAELRTEATRMNCNSAVCYTFECTLGRMSRGDTATITITSRLWEATLLKAKAGVVNLETTAHLTVPSHLQQPNNTNDQVSVVLVAKPSRAGSEVIREETPWWIYLLAVLGGLLLLTAAISIMYRFGFFERHRHEDSSTDPDELKPMNM